MQPNDFVKGGYSIEQDENKYGIEEFRKASENSMSKQHRTNEKQTYNHHQ